MTAKRALPPEGSERAYRIILGMLHKNTGHGSPVTMSASHLWNTVRHASLSKGDAKTALQAARENGDVHRWQDGEGQIRYALAADGVDELPDTEMPIYTSEDVDALKAVIDVEVSRPDDELDQNVIGWANTHLQAIKEGSDGDL
ncbi:hypothetical protein [Halobellus sp. H-GB7]|uniref:hypothetical protein n=1 Tax=Halobellus sp. H-GB7 TaxID=3069756 RepID=UPI0027B2B32F|nr:hypothetical protein [Halobellus sp. H-GB7]MDQ2053261.1 hypothetical protein [Halobellus sp. H-GB7]